MTELKLTKVPSMTVGMLIRRAPEDVFRAFVDPAVTTKFWFTHSTGPLAPGAKVEWRWEMYDLTAPVAVREFEENERVVIDWSDDSTTVEFRFVPWKNDTTFLRITETGQKGTGDEVATALADSSSGFSFVLAAAKAWLEHDLELNIVLDRAPAGLDA